ncbi:MAG: hypothetical protein ACXVQY_04495 [Actinomycetota bacterium]
MRLAVASANLILGAVYTSYGIMTLIDMKRGWRAMGFSHFGAAWTAMAFTCGPHHLAHGLHGFFGGREGGGLDLAAVLVGAPAGVAWFLLRVEAFRGGRGDRFISGTPAFIGVIPFFSAVYMTALVAAVIRLQGFEFKAVVAPSIMLVVLYFIIGYFLMRTQLRNHAELGGWSVSGLSLLLVFPTCGLMHGIFAVYRSTGRYAYDVQSLVIDWLAVPAALYFLWVVRGLYLDALHDWNEALPAESLATS